MDTITINLPGLSKYILLAGVTIFYIIVARKLGKRPGWLSGIDLIVPTFWYLIFVIIWLIIFFVIL